VASSVLEGMDVNDQIHEDSFLGAQTLLPTRVMLHTGELEHRSSALGLLRKVTGAGLACRHAAARRPRKAAGQAGRQDRPTKSRHDSA
jgi:hypothetical protein